MLCPACSSESEVLSTTLAGVGTVVTRRRRCKKCSIRWTTHEKVAQERVETERRKPRRKVTWKDPPLHDFSVLLDDDFSEDNDYLPEA